MLVASLSEGCLPHGMNLKKKLSVIFHIKVPACIESLLFHDSFFGCAGSGGHFGESFSHHASFSSVGKCASIVSEKQQLLKCICTLFVKLNFSLNL